MSQSRSVLLVGLGNIGFRHLQGMGSIAPETRLVAVDPFEAARVRSQEEWEKAGGAYARFLDTVEETGPADVAIVATSAAGRLALMRQVIDVARPPKLVLEKVVFQDVEDFPRARDLAAQAGTDVWVNCPRRLWPVYQAMKDTVQGEAFTLEVVGRNIGLACNGVHFIDLLQFLAGESTVRADTVEIDEIIPAKREGYFEALGRMGFTTPSGARLDIRVDADSPEKTAVAIVRADGSRIEIDDASGAVTGLGDEARDYGRSPYQSELTGAMVTDLIETGDCGLATLAESEAAHRAFLGALEPAFQAKGIDTSAGLPIT